MGADAFRAAVEAGDTQAAMDLLDEGIVFRSPAVHKPYTSKAEVAALLSVIAETFEDFTYTGSVEQGDEAVLFFHARVGDRELDGIDHLRFGPDGRITEFTVMIRPLSGLIRLAETVGPRLAARAAQP